MKMQGRRETISEETHIFGLQDKIDINVAYFNFLFSLLVIIPITSQKNMHKLNQAKNTLFCN